MSDVSPLRIEKAGDIGYLIIDRADKRNAMNDDFFALLPMKMAELGNDDDVRAVILRGEGKCFTAGIDLVEAASLLSLTGADGREKLRLKILELQRAITSVERCPKPVIAAVHGHCIGGGVDLICACDIRLASRDALFSIRETRLAMIADLGTLQRLPHIIGDGWFRELVYTGRDFGADEALQMGLVTRLCEDRFKLVRAAHNLAEEIAQNSPIAVQGAKDVILKSRDLGVPAGLEYVAQKNSSALHCEDLMEAMQSFMMKKKPEFKGR